MRKGNILIELFITVAVIAVVLYFFTKNMGYTDPTVTPAVPQDTQTDMIMPESESTVPSEFQNSEADQPGVSSALPAEYKALLAYIEAYGGIALPPALLPPLAEFPQVDPAEIDTTELLGINTGRPLGYLPAPPYAGTVESDKICNRLLTSHSKMSVRLCGDEISCLDRSVGQINVEDTALVIFNSDPYFLITMTYEPELNAETYDSGAFRLTVNNINVDNVINGEDKLYNQNILIVTTQQLSRVLNCK